MPPHPKDNERRQRLFNVLRREVPRRPDPSGPPKPPRRLEVFGVGPDWVQLTWSALGPGAIRFRVAGSEIVVEADGGPGAAVLDDLVPGTPVEVAVTGPGIDGEARLPTVTLPRPEGALLRRVATLSDIHVGSNSTGYLHTMIELPPPAEPYAVRCFRAAMAESAAWGAEEYVLKGDIVDVSNAQNWQIVADVLRGVDVPVHSVSGNHEWSRDGDGNPRRGIARSGLQLAPDVATVDRDGLRIVLVDTTLPGHDHGKVANRRHRVATAAAEADRPVLVTMHHQLTRLPVPTYLPPGILGPEAVPFLDALGRANPNVVVTSGHTHRHRRWAHGSVTVTEVGSTKDFPGTWAGYEVYETGLVQTVRRIAEPSCIRWTDHTRRAALGVWGWWAPGTLADRCFTLRF